MRFGYLVLKNFRQLLYKIDMFGSPIHLQVKKESEYHTILGVLISIGILGFIYYSFLSLVIDMFDRSSPNVIQNIQYQSNPEEFSLEEDQFIFMVAITDLYGLPITQKQGSLIYSAQFQMCNRVTDSSNNINSNCSTFNLQSCATIQINSVIQQKLNISAAVLASSVCFNPDDWKTITISLQGTPQTPVFKNLYFKVFSCVNSTENNNGCASQQVIDTKLSTAYVGLFVSDYVINQQQPDNPYSAVSKLISTTIANQQFKSMTLWMRKSIFYNTENFYYYFEKNSKYEALQFDRQSEYLGTYNSSTSQLIEITMYLDDREALYYRTYNNILDILGNMGGLLELMIFIGGMIVNPINKLSCELFLAQEIFQFEKEQDDDAKVHPIKNDILNQLEGKISESQLNQLKRYFKLKAKQLKLFVHKYIFTCGNDKAQIDHSIEMMYKKIDVIFLINKLIEIDKLKKLMLNENQQILFNYIHKPKIFLGKRPPMRSSIYSNPYDDSTEVSLEQEILQAYNSYQIIKDTQNNNRYINSNLLKLMDQDIKKIFDNNKKGQGQTNIPLKNSMYQINTNQLLNSSIHQMSIDENHRIDQSNGNLIQEIESVLNI